VDGRPHSLVDDDGGLVVLTWGGDVYRVRLAGRLIRLSRGRRRSVRLLCRLIGWLRRLWSWFVRRLGSVADWLRWRAICWFFCRLVRRFCWLWLRPGLVLLLRWLWLVCWFGWGCRLVCRFGWRRRPIDWLLGRGRLGLIGRLDGRTAVGLLGWLWSVGWGLWSSLLGRVRRFDRFVCWLSWYWSRLVRWWWLGLLRRRIIRLLGWWRLLVLWFRRRKWLICWLRLWLVNRLWLRRLVSWPGGRGRLINRLLWLINLLKHRWLLVDMDWRMTSIYDMRSRWRGRVARLWLWFVGWGFGWSRGIVSLLGWWGLVARLRLVNWLGRSICRLWWSIRRLFSCGRFVWRFC